MGCSKQSLTAPASLILVGDQLLQEAWDVEKIESFLNWQISDLNRLHRLTFTALSIESSQHHQVCCVRHRTLI